MTKVGAQSFRVVSEGDSPFLETNRTGFRVVYPFACGMVILLSLNSCQANPNHFAPSTDYDLEQVLSWLPTGVESVCISRGPFSSYFGGIDENSVEVMGVYGGIIWSRIGSTIPFFFKSVPWSRKDVDFAVSGFMDFSHYSDTMSSDAKRVGVIEFADPIVIHSIKLRIGTPDNSRVDYGFLDMKGKQILLISYDPSPLWSEKSKLYLYFDGPFLFWSSDRDLLRALLEERGKSVSAKECMVDWRALGQFVDTSAPIWGFHRFPLGAKDVGSGPVSEKRDESSGRIGLGPSIPKGEDGVWFWLDPDQQALVIRFFSRQLLHLLNLSKPIADFHREGTTVTLERVGDDLFEMRISGKKASQFSVGVMAMLGFQFFH